MNRTSRRLLFGTTALLWLIAAGWGAWRCANADGQRELGAEWARAVGGTTGFGTEPLREAVQVSPAFSPAAALADVPAGWPVVAATRSTPHWRAQRAIQPKGADERLAH